MFYHKLRKHRKKVFLAGCIYLLFFSAKLLYDSVPDEIYVVKGEEKEITFSVPVSVEKKEESMEVFKNLNQTHTDYQLSCHFLHFIPVKDVDVHVVDKKYVLPSGMPIGIYAKTNGVLVLGTGKVTASDGLNHEPAYQLVQSGDYIVSVNGIRINGKAELIHQINASEGKALVLGIVRDNEWIEIKVQPIVLEDGSYKLGIWVRDDMAGVGTLTYVQENLSFGALGHPISDADTGGILSVASGSVYDTEIIGIVKGEDGIPGELTGVINYNDEFHLGSIQENSKDGIYGILDEIPQEIAVEYMEVGLKQDIQKGDAYILSSLDGELQQYQVEIDEINFNSEEENKGILFHVVDSELLETTGGVVQGMSGSPLVQNGKIIGAVTHVFVNDPTKGYGIFIEEMLEHN